MQHMFRCVVRSRPAVCISSVTGHFSKVTPARPGVPAKLLQRQPESSESAVTAVIVQFAPPADTSEYGRCVPALWAGVSQETHSKTGFLAADVIPSKKMHAL